MAGCTLKACSKNYERSFILSNKETCKVDGGLLEQCRDERRDENAREKQDGSLTDFLDKIIRLGLKAYQSTVKK